MMNTDRRVQAMHMVGSDVGRRDGDRGHDRDRYRDCSHGPPRGSMVRARSSRYQLALALIAVLAVHALSTAAGLRMPDRYALQSGGDAWSVAAAQAQQPMTSTVTATVLPTETPPPTATQASATSIATETVVPTSTIAQPARSPTPTAQATSPQAFDELRPLLTVQRVQVKPDRPAPGQSFELDVDVVNVGRSPARDVRFSWTSAVFVPDGGSTELFRSVMRAGEERDFETRLRVSMGTSAGTYPIDVVISWRDDDGVADSLQTQIAVEVVGQALQRPLVVVQGSRLPSTVAPGLPFDGAFEVLNAGSADAHNVTVVPTSGPLALQGTGRGAPPTLAPGGTAVIGLRLIASTPGQPGANQQVFELRWEDAEGERYTDSVIVGLSIRDAAAFGPMPMVVGYEVIGDVYPGESFELQLEVVNVGVTAADRTVMVLGSGTSGGGAGTGGSTMGVFAPLQSSNRRYLDRLGVDERRTVVQRMMVDGAAKPGVYVLDVGFSYYNSQGEILSSSEVITLIVMRRIAIQLNPIDVMTSTIVGRPIAFAVEIINAGADTINVNTVEFIGGRYLDVQAVPRFIGALEAGGVDVIDATLVPRAPSDSVEVRVVVNYRDDLNQEQAFEQSFMFEILESSALSTEVTAPVATTHRSFMARFLRGIFGLGASPPPPSRSNDPSGSSGQVETGNGVPADGLRMDAVP